tara:strand:- start:1147 stop:1662 length:516 start_codon:yes stop_codon:yes gene_type:complete
MVSESIAELKERLQLFLNEHNTLTIATRNTQSIWAATVFYIADTEMNLYFLSSDKTRHIQDIESNNEVAITIYQDVSDWQSIQGVQATGHVSHVGEDNKSSVLNQYITKYIFLKELLNNPKDEQEERIAQQFKTISLFKLKPFYYRIIDNSIEFGYKQEITLIAGSWTKKD